MKDRDRDVIGKVLRGALAGAVAGLAASFVMDRFQAAVGAIGDSDGDEEPATEKAADAVATSLTGRSVPEPEKPLAGQAVHYLLGVTLGVAYGVTAEFRPSVTAGYGTAFGLGTATLLDEAAVPAAGLGAVPWEAGWSTNLYAYASHLVFGGTTELVRRRIRATLDR